MESNIWIDGENCKTKDEMLRTFSEILQFPDYFGYNWDALSDILYELSMSTSCRVMIYNYGSFLSEELESKEIFKDIIDNLGAESKISFWKTKRI